MTTLTGNGTSRGRLASAPELDELQQEIKLPSAPENYPTIDQLLASTPESLIGTSKRLEKTTCRNNLLPASNKRACFNARHPGQGQPGFFFCATGIPTSKHRRMFGGHEERNSERSMYVCMYVCKTLLLFVRTKN